MQSSPSGSGTTAEPSAGGPGLRGRVTILDVARRAGVSHQTVSRYLRHNGGLKPATVAAIDIAIAELDYRPNLVARSLRTRRSRRIAIVLPELKTYTPTLTLHAASVAAHAAGYGVDVVSLEGGELERRDRVLELVRGARVEGILTLTTLGGPADDLSDEVPVSVVDEYDDEMRATGAFADGRPAAEIVERLAALGHRVLLHVAGAPDWLSARNRSRVYTETIGRLGLRSAGTIDGDWSVRSGYDAARDLPEDVTAVFAANDKVALGVIRGLHDRGLRVPEDVSVVGWDDVEFTRYMAPTMSTVALDREAQGRRAMEALVARIEGRAAPEPDVEPLARVLFRGSTGPVRGA